PAQPDPPATDSGVRPRAWRCGAGDRLRGIRAGRRNLLSPGGRRPGARAPRCARRERARAGGAAAGGLARRDTDPRDQHGPGDRPRYAGSVRRAVAEAALPVIRRQLPVYSPVTLSGVARAGTAPARPSEVDALRQELAARYSAPKVELWGSGTQSLQVAITMAQKRLGGAVALPAFQCYDLASAAAGAGVKVS